MRTRVGPFLYGQFEVITHAHRQCVAVGIARFQAFEQSPNNFLKLSRRASNEGAGSGMAIKPRSFNRGALGDQPVGNEIDFFGRTA